MQRVVWTGWFGPVDIKLDNLIPLNTTKAIPKLIEDIKKNGLLNPLEVIWYLNDSDRIQKIEELYIAKGNQRIQVLKSLGWKKAPCYIRVYASEGTMPIAWALKKILPLVNEQSGERTKGVEYKEWQTPTS